MKTSILKRALISTALITVLMSSSPASAASLRELSILNADVVRLGDVFDGVEKADTVLGKAPQPGKDMVLNISTLKRLANSHNVDWEPASVSDTVTLRREAHTIDAKTIQETLKAALAEKGVEGNLAVTLNKSNVELVLPSSIEPTIEVSKLDYIEGKQVFTATLASPSADKPLKTLTVTGLIDRLVQIPVLNNTIKSGEIIGSGDIAFIDVPEHELANGVIMDADDLIGKTPSRMISSNKPMRQAEIKSPQLVARGEEVTIEYLLGGMSLTAKGKSLQTGGAGDIVRVTNLTSNKSVSAKVTGDRTVTVE